MYEFNEWVRTTRVKEKPEEVGFEKSRTTAVLGIQVLRIMVQFLQNSQDETAPTLFNLHH